jgi:hypothetical protein
MHTLHAYMSTQHTQMCSPRGHQNLLTSPADPTWRAVRKAVAAAFSVVNIRKKYPVSGHVCTRCMPPCRDPQVAYRIASALRPNMRLQLRI